LMTQEPDVLLVYWPAKLCDPEVSAPAVQVPSVGVPTFSSRPVAFALSLICVSLSAVVASVSPAETFMDVPKYPVRHVAAVAPMSRTLVVAGTMPPQFDPHITIASLALVASTATSAEFALLRKLMVPAVGNATVPVVAGVVPSEIDGALSATVATPAPLTALAGITITGAHCVAPPAVTTLVCADAQMGTSAQKTALRIASLTGCTHN